MKDIAENVIEDGNDFSRYLKYRKEIEENEKEFKEYLEYKEAKAKNLDNLTVFLFVTIGIPAMVVFTLLMYGIID